MKKLIATFLLISMLAVISCGVTGTQDETTSDYTTAVSTTSDTTIGRDTPDFEKTDFGGAEFTILGFEFDFYDKYFFAEEQNGERMNDAIYERQIKTEDYLGVKFNIAKATAFDTVLPTLQQSIAAGDDKYQLVLPHCISGISSMVSDGMLYDVNNIADIDLSKDYYNHNVNENLSLNGRNYYFVSDYMICNPNCVLFNKQLVSDFKLDDPYQLVYDGRWTFDKMYEMGHAVAGDISGDGTIDINDRFGLTGEGDWMLNSILYACGLKLVEKTNNGFKLGINNEKTVHIIEQLHNELSGNSVYLWKINDNKENMLQIDSGRTLFQLYPLYKIYDFRDSAVDYGVLPYPKYDEAQEKYLSNDWSSLMCIPISITNPEMVGKVIEYLSYISNDTTIPAYYGITLSGKLARDENSSKMMDIIFDNIVFDAGMNYWGFDSNMMGLFYVLPMLVVQNGSTDFASWYKTYADGAQATMDKFVANLPD